MLKYYDLINLFKTPTMHIIVVPRHYGIYIGELKMKSQINDKEDVKFRREFTNIARMNRDLKKYAYKMPLTLNVLNYHEIIELEYILDSMSKSCDELKRLYNFKKWRGGD